MAYAYDKDGSNWLTDVDGNGLSRDYVYDPNGNMTADEDYVTDVDYDIFNMPIVVTTTQATAYNRYDVHNRRVYRRLASVDTTFYVRGADGTTLAVYDGSGDLMYWNILGAGEIIGRTLEDTAKEVPSTAVQYYVKDHLGSIRGTINEGGSADHQSDYYPFGLEMPSRVWTTDPPRERYTGHEIEELGSNTTWYYAGARMYDPVVARWATTDPLAGKFPGWSPYNYVGGNPISLFDPDGMAPRECPPCKDVFENEVRALVDEVKQRTDPVIDATHRAVIDGTKVTAKIADGASDLSTVAAIGALLAAPFTGGTSLAVAAKALAAGTIADVTSTAAKGIIALDGGSNAAFEQQLAESLINVGAARLTKLGLQHVVVRAGANVSGPLFRSARTGRFVSNRFGLSTAAAADATAVGVNMIDLEDLLVPVESAQGSDRP